MTSTTTAIHRTAPDPALTEADMIRRAEALVPLLRERAAEVDANRRVHDDTYERLLDAGFLHMLKPKRYGGLELTEHAHAQVTVALAHGCASTAWTFSILSSDNMAIAAFPEETQEEIWGENPYATLAGNTNLNTNATTERVDGGYLLSGKWGFCSGSDFSEWLVFNAPVGDEGEGHMFLVRSSEAERTDDWHPTGMRGTGSRSMAVDRVFVPDRRIQATKDTVDKLKERRALHPTFGPMYASWPSHGRFSFAACALGAALGAAEHFAETVGSSSRVDNALGGRIKLSEQDYVASEFAEAYGELKMAKLLVDHHSSRASERAERHVASTPLESAQDQLANAQVTRTALRSVQRIFSLIGSKAGSPLHPVSLAKRDVEMISHHVTLNWRQAATRYLATVAGE